MLRNVCLLILIASCGGAAPTTKPSTATAPAKPAGPTTTLWTFADYSDAPNPAEEPSPKWIWGPKDATAGEDRYFRISFDAKFKPGQKSDKVSAWLWGACDDNMTVYLNGKMVTNRNGHGQAVLADVHTVLTPGENVLAVKCHNDVGPAAIALKLEVRNAKGATFQLVTNDKWTTSREAPEGWRNKKFKDAGKTFEPVNVLGPYGMEPWGKVPAPVPEQATSVENLALPAGFKAELVYSVPKGSQGSWVSMTPDPKGRLYVSDQNGPLYRVTPGVGDKPTEVEPVDLEIGSSQGMLWAFDSLYVVVNSRDAKRPSGLYRLRDTDGDDKLDDIKTLKEFKDRAGTGPGAGEHGPHAVVLGPDKKIYFVAGNFTNLPYPVEPTSPAQHWAEDLLLPRMTDGKGHDPTIYAPASCVSRTDEEGKTWEVVANGMRNAYDIAFNDQGELFTFDSDMEWDIGAPWWRPIRICHITSGAEFGWRNGSAKWPTYYPDSVPPVVDIGIGSPTGVTFGYGAKFPEKYQRAFFASDWAYGKLYAVHLKPNGATYAATFEPFIIGKPFDITDVVINHDGNMYITIGGRGTQSGLYRVSYVGEESTAPVKPIEDPKSAEARAIRHKLEAFHGHRNAQAVSIAWPYLSSEDRALRYAARVAIEFQDVSEWIDKAEEEKNPTAAINGLLALSRVGNKWAQPRILEALNRLDLKQLTEEQLLEALRAYEVCFSRMGKPADPATAPGIAARLEALYPHKSTNANHELCQILTFLESPKVVEKSLPLLAEAKTQEEQLFYAFTLRNLRDSWTKPQRETYFNWLNRAQQNYTGGASFKLFLKHVREDAIRTLGDNEKTALATLLKEPIQLAPADDDEKKTTRKFVKSWAMADLVPKLEKLKSGRSYENGRAAFSDVSCLKCHRFNGGGGASGPDITGAGNRFQPADLLEAIVLPSKVISDQYQATEIITKKKQVFVGSVQEENDLAVILRSSPLSTETETVPKSQIATRRPSKLSIMPQGLLDVLSEDDVLDLLAYVRAAGDPNDKAFQKATATSQSP